MLSESVALLEVDAIAIAALSTPEAPLLEPTALCALAHLRYVNTDEPGYTRKRCGRGFAYIDTDGRVLRDRTTRRRLAALAVPPAWTDVWYCVDPDGHIQATGRDEKNRKQYIYHTEWRERRDRSKFAQLTAFARSLAGLRRRIEKDLACASHEEDSVLAAAAQLLDLTGIRVGNRNYFDENGTVGLMTLQKRHTRIRGKTIALKFTAKSGRPVELTVSDRRLAKALLRCEELPGQQLFCYRTDNEVRQIDSARFNDYLRSRSGADITAKDFRTWIATVTVVEAWLQTRERPLKIKEATSVAAKRLANTPAVTRRAYIHPDVLALVTERPPTPEECRAGRRNGARLSGPELLCSRLLGA